MQLIDLLNQMHNYTKIELYLKKHRDIRNDPELIQTFNQQLNPEELRKMLVPIISDSSESTPSSFPNDFFFQEDDPLKIKVSQHTRYSTPIVHKHEFYELFYVYEGEFIQRINQQEMVMHTGDFCLIQPGVYHSLDVNNYSIVLNILIEKKTFEKFFFQELIGEDYFANFFRRNFFSEKLNTYIIFKTNGDREIQNLVLNLYLETLNKKDYYAQMTQSYLLLIFSYLLRNFKESAIIPKPQEAQKLIDFKLTTTIQNQYQSITLTKLANQFNYSTQYVSHRIKQATGLSFTKYLTYRRMQVATELLKDTPNKVKDISQLVGFNNQENFIRTFKKTFNVTPSQYRRNHHTLT